MLAVDEDLRPRRALGALAHLGALGGIFHHVHLVVGGALLVEQSLGAGAVAAPGRGVDLDLGHPELLGPTITPAVRPAPASAHRHAARRLVPRCERRHRPWRRSSARRRPAGPPCPRARRPSADGCRTPAARCCVFPWLSGRPANRSTAAAAVSRGRPSRAPPPP